MIPETEFIREGQVVAVTQAMIEARHGIRGWRQFSAWFGVGTCPLFEDGSTGIYASDYIRWIEGLPNDD